MTKKQQEELRKEERKQIERNKWLNEEYYDYRLNKDFVIYWQYYIREDCM